MAEASVEKTEQPDVEVIVPMPRHKNVGRCHARPVTEPIPVHEQVPVTSRVEIPNEVNRE